MDLSIALAVQSVRHPSWDVCIIYMGHKVSGVRKGVWESGAETASLWFVAYTYPGREKDRHQLARLRVCGQRPLRLCWFRVLSNFMTACLRLSETLRKEVRARCVSLQCGQGLLVCPGPGPGRLVGFVVWTV